MYIRGCSMLNSLNAVVHCVVFSHLILTQGWHADIGGIELGAAWGGTQWVGSRGSPVCMKWHSWGPVQARGCGHVPSSSQKIPKPSDLHSSERTFAAFTFYLVWCQKQPTAPESQPKCPINRHMQNVGLRKNKDICLVSLAFCQQQYVDGQCTQRLRPPVLSYCSTWVNLQVDVLLMPASCNCLSSLVTSNETCGQCNAALQHLFFVICQLLCDKGIRTVSRGEHRLVSVSWN